MVIVMSKNTRRRERFILLVEDSTRERRALRDLFTTDGWSVITAQDEEDAMHQIQQADQMGQRLELVLIDLGLPPAVDDWEVGLKLAQQIRFADEDVSILAYTATRRDAEMTSLILSQLLPLRVSFVYSRHLSDEGWMATLDFVSQGFYLLDEGSSRVLPTTISDRSDPFEDKHWSALYWLDKGYTQPQVAQKIDGIGSEEAIRSWLRKMRDILTHRGELHFDARTSDLLHWYRENRVKYHRLCQSKDDRQLF